MIFLNCGFQRQSSTDHWCIIRYWKRNSKRICKTRFYCNFGCKKKRQTWTNWKSNAPEMRNENCYWPENINISILNPITYEKPVCTCITNVFTIVCAIKTNHWWYMLQKKLIQLIITKTYQLTDLLKHFATCFEFFKTPSNLSQSVTLTENCK